MVIMSFILFLPFAMIYFLPFLCACGKGHSARVAFFFANLFFGWTCIGWLVLLIMAANTKPAVVPVAIVSVIPPVLPATVAAVVLPAVVTPSVQKLTGERFNFATQTWEKYTQ